MCRPGENTGACRRHQHPLYLILRPAICFQRTMVLNLPMRYTMKRISIACITALLAISLAACDGGPGPDRAGRADVRSLTVIFSMADAVINNNVASVQYDVPAITRRVVDEGAVIAFFREQNTWTAMPYTFGEESADLPAVDYTLTIGYGFERNFLEVFYEASSNAVNLAAEPNRTIKVVIIDSVPGKAGVDLSDYEAVKAYYGLDE
jgi:hypothetical protein